MLDLIDDISMINAADSKTDLDDRRGGGPLTMSALHVGTLLGTLQGALSHRERQNGSDASPALGGDGRRRVRRAKEGGNVDVVVGCRASDVMIVLSRRNVTYRGFVRVIGVDTALRYFAENEFEKTSEDLQKVFRGDGVTGGHGGA